MRLAACPGVVSVAMPRRNNPMARSQRTTFARTQRRVRGLALASLVVSGCAGVEAQGGATDGTGTGVGPAADGAETSTPAGGTATAGPVGDAASASDGSSATASDGDETGTLPPADRTVTQFSPYLEWTVENPSYEGNPFDVVATVTFTHDGDAQSHQTQMFYDGDNIWKFRFTGTLTGRWTYSSESDDPELAGHGGTIDVDPQPDDGIYGFIGSVGNRFVRARGDTQLVALSPNTFMEYPPGVDHDTPFFGLYDEAQMQAYVDASLAHGCPGVFSSYVANHWFAYGDAAYSGSTPHDPDPETFRGLELLITTAHRSGGYAHIWAWGDQSRQWTPNGVGGINGEADRRLQRYIAARLGPLPGWVMGYGFDLHEWTSPEQLQAWADYLGEHLGWQHLLGTRAYNIEGPTYDAYSSADRPEEELSTVDGGPANFAEIGGHIDDDAAHPHWYTERHSYLRDGFALSMVQTRRLMWWQTMAGGVGGWFGFYPDSTRPYPNPEQMQTHFEFWTARGHFTVGMERMPSLSSDADTRVLAEDSRVVLYREGAGSITMDLTTIGGQRSAIAVDTAAAYAEIDLGVLPTGLHTWTAPYASDWAVAIGDFSEP